MGNGKTPWWALAGAGMIAAPLPAATGDDGLMNFKPKEQAEETQESPDQFIAQRTDDLIDALGMPQPEQKEPPMARTLMQIHKDGVEAMKEKGNPLAGAMEAITPVARRFSTIPFNSFGRNINHALHANQVEKTRQRIRERKKQEELGVPQEPVENIFDKAFDAIGDFVGDLFGVQAAGAQSIDLSKYNDRDTTETRESIGIANIDDKRFAAALRAFNWTGINTVQGSDAKENFLAAFSTKYLGDTILPQGTGDPAPSPAFQTPEDGIRYFGWWLESKGNPGTLRELADGWWKNDTANKDPWLASVSSLSGLEPDDNLTSHTLPLLFEGIAAHEGGHAFTQTFGTTHDINIGHYIRQGQEMHREAALQLGQMPGDLPEGRPTTIPEKPTDEVMAQRVAAGDAMAAAELAAEEGKEALAETPVVQNPVRFILSQSQIIGYDGSVLANKPYTDLNESEKLYVDIITRFMNKSSGSKKYGEGEGKVSVTTGDGAWCAAFVDHILFRVGKEAARLDWQLEDPLSKNTDRFNRVRAAALQNLGTKVEDPADYQIGDVVVLQPKSRYHTGFYAGTVDRYDHTSDAHTRAVQTALASLNEGRADTLLDPGVVDGDYGPNTTKAIKAYQKHVLGIEDKDIQDSLSAEQYEALVGSAPTSQRMVAILGGNQNNQVNITYYPLSRVTSVQRIDGMESLSEEDFKELSKDMVAATGGSVS